MHWMKFEEGQYPRTGEIIAVKGCAGIYPYLLKAFCDKHKTLQYHRLLDETTHVVIDYGITHWKLIESAISDDEEIGWL